MILKIFRNSIDGNIRTAGGIWNLFNVLFVMVAMYLLITRKNSLRDRPNCVNWALGYSAISFSLSLLSVPSFAPLDIFRILMIFFFPSMICVFYTYGKRGFPPFAKGILYIIFYIVTIFCSVLMLQRVQGAYAVYQSDMYFSLCLFPFILLYGKKFSFYTPLFLMFFVLILSAKRVGTLALTSALLAFYYIQLRTKKDLKTLLSILLKFVLAVLIVYYLYSFLADNFDITIIERLQNLKKDGGSGRDDIYIGLLKRIRDSHPLYWITGYGNSAVMNVYGRTSAAHNDFIEIMFDYGIFSVLAILGFYISMVKECIKMIKHRFYGASAFGASIIIALFMSMFSNFIITFTHIMGIAAFWGVCLAEWRNFKPTSANKLNAGGDLRVPGL